MLSKLCQLEKNEAILSECLEGDTYSRIVQLLTVHDIQLLVHTLEALYQLSELGDTTTNMIAHVKSAVGQCCCLVLCISFLNSVGFGVSSSIIFWYLSFPVRPVFAGLQRYV